MAHSSKSILKPERAHATANDTFVFLLELLPIRWLSPDRGTADLDHLEPLRVMHYLHYGRLIIGSLVALVREQHTVQRMSTDPDSDHCTIAHRCGVQRLLPPVGKVPWPSTGQHQRTLVCSHLVRRQLREINQ